MVVRNNLSELLKTKDKSLYWLAKETKISYPTLFKINRNETESIKFQVLEAICSALECKIEELLEFVEE